MKINFTLVIQLVNFFIAYILIERLLVRPAVALIRAEDEERFKLTNLVAFNKARLEQKQLDADQKWRTMQGIFAQSMPRTITLDAQAFKQVMINPQQPEKSTIEITVQESTAFLVTKVGHE